MTDFEAMRNTLIASGYEEDAGFIITTYENGSKDITLYKTIYMGNGHCEEIEFNFKYDENEKLKEIW